MVADLPVAMSPSSGAITNTILRYRISPRSPSSARVDLSGAVGSALIAPSRVLRFTTPIFSACKRSDDILSPATGVLVVSPRSLVARPGSPCRSNGLHD